MRERELVGRDAGLRVCNIFVFVIMGRDETVNGWKLQGDCRMSMFVMQEWCKSGQRKNGKFDGEEVQARTLTHSSFSNAQHIPSQGRSTTK